MRKIKMFNQVSADGFFAAPDGNLDWVTSDDEVGKTAMAGGGIDTVLFGRKTYEMFASFWPKVLEEKSDTAPDPHAPGKRSKTMRQMAEWLTETQKIVVSRSLTDPTWKNTRVIRDLSLRAIEAMKQEPGKDLILFGSGSIVQQLTRAGLIDEYQFVVSPILLGAGKNLLADAPKRSLALAESKSFDSGVVLLRYTVTR